jgi:hypothetical protein
MRSLVLWGQRLSRQLPNAAKRANQLRCLNREQYGESPLFPRRWSPDPVHQRNYKNYTSDWDYFWNYQVNHMFNRYLGWNFIGRESDIQDAGVDPSKLWALPFILGIIGLYLGKTFEATKNRPLYLISHQI